MSEEKLYAVKNYDGKYWDFSDITGFWSIYLDISDCPTTTSKKQAELVTDEQGGHIVTFVEEHKKVVLTKEQADCPYCHDPFLDFSGLTDDELDWKQEAFCSVDENRHINYGSFGDGYDGESKTIIINYCPMCGRDLRV